MTDDIFQDPHTDETAEDPFITPDDDEFEEELGASPVNPVEAARAPQKRKAIFLIGGALAAIALLFAITTRGGDDPADTAETVTAAEQAGSLDPVVRAEQPARQPAADTRQLIEQEPATPAPEQRGTGEFIDPSDFAAEREPSSFRPAQGEGRTAQPSSSSAAQSGRGQTAQGGDRQTTEPASPYMPPNRTEGQIGDSPGVPFSQDELERQARLDAQREAEALRQAEEERLAEYRTSEEERLRGSATLIAGGQIEVQSPAGQSRFGAVVQPPVTGTGAAGGEDRSVQSERIIPGTQIPAVLTSTYKSDLGQGRVQARLNAPLRDRNNAVILPAGTRAFGTASATSPSPGEPPRVTMGFNVFVKPSGEVVRGVTAEAIDPETLASSVSGDVDRHLTERIIRGVAATAVDLALTSQADDRRTAFEQPSAEDLAIQDARQRAAALIEGDVGDENSLDATVTLEQGTTFVLMFGL